MRLILPLCIAVLCFAQTASASEPIKMSLSTIILFALDKNPDLQVAEQRVIQMNEFTNEARADYLPRVEVTFEGGRQYVKPAAGSSNSNFGEASVRLSQPLYGGSAITSEVNRRENVRDSVAFKGQSQKKQIILETVRLYLTVLRYQEELDKLNGFIREIDAIVANIQEMYTAGAISKVMNDYAGSRQAAAHLERSRAKSSLNDALSNLEFLTGALPEFRAVVPDELTPEKYEFDLYFELAENQNSKIKTNQAELRALKHKLNVEKAAYLPEVGLNVDAERSFNDGGDNGSANDVSASLTMRYEIFDGFLRKHKSNRVVSEIKELEFKNDKIVKELKKDLQLAYHQVLSSKLSLDSVRAEIKNSITVKILNAENFRLGNINAIELIEGEERLKDAYLKRHRFQFEMNLNKFKLLIDSTILNDEFFCLSCKDIKKL